MPRRGKRDRDGAIDGSETAERIASGGAAAVAADLDQSREGDQCHWSGSHRGNHPFRDVLPPAHERLSIFFPTNKIWRDGARRITDILDTCAARNYFSLFVFIGKCLGFISRCGTREAGSDGFHFTDQTGAVAEKVTVVVQLIVRNNGKRSLIGASHRPSTYDLIDSRNHVGLLMTISVNDDRLHFYQLVEALVEAISEDAAPERRMYLNTTREPEEEQDDGNVEEEVCVDDENSSSAARDEDEDLPGGGDDQFAEWSIGDGDEEGGGADERRRRRQSSQRMIDGEAEEDGGDEDDEEERDIDGSVARTGRGGAARRQSQQQQQQERDKGKKKKEPKKKKKKQQQPRKQTKKKDHQFKGEPSIQDIMNNPMRIISGIDTLWRAIQLLVDVGTDGNRIADRQAELQHLRTLRGKLQENDDPDVALWRSLNMKTALELANREASNQATAMRTDRSTRSSDQCIAGDDCSISFVEINSCQLSETSHLINPDDPSSAAATAAMAAMSLSDATAAARQQGYVAQQQQQMFTCPNRSGLPSLAERTKRSEDASVARPRVAAMLRANFQPAALRSHESCKEDGPCGPVDVAGVFEWICSKAAAERRGFGEVLSEVSEDGPGEAADSSFSRSEYSDEFESAPILEGGGDDARCSFKAADPDLAWKLEPWQLSPDVLPRTSLPWCTSGILQILAKMVSKYTGEPDAAVMLAAFNRNTISADMGESERRSQRLGIPLPQAKLGGIYGDVFGRRSATSGTQDIISEIAIIGACVRNCIEYVNARFDAAVGKRAAPRGADDRHLSNDGPRARDASEAAAASVSPPPAQKRSASAYGGGVGSSSASPSPPLGLSAFGRPARNPLRSTAAAEICPAAESTWHTPAAFGGAAAAATAGSRPGTPGEYEGFGGGFRKKLTETGGGGTGGGRMACTCGSMQCNAGSDPSLCRIRREFGEDAVKEIDQPTHAKIVRALRRIAMRETIVRFDDQAMVPEAVKVIANWIEERDGAVSLPFTHEISNVGMFPSVLANIMVGLSFATVTVNHFQVMLLMTAREVACLGGVSGSLAINIKLMGPYGVGKSAALMFLALLSILNGSVQTLGGASLKAILPLHEDGSKSAYGDCLILMDELLPIFTKHPDKIKDGADVGRMLTSAMSSGRLQYTVNAKVSDSASGNRDAIRRVSRSIVALFAFAGATNDPQVDSAISNRFITLHVRSETKERSSINMVAAQIPRGMRDVSAPISSISVDDGIIDVFQCFNALAFSACKAIQGGACPVPEKSMLRVMLSAAIRQLKKIAPQAVALRIRKFEIAWPIADVWTIWKAISFCFSDIGNSPRRYQHYNISTIGPYLHVDQDICFAVIALCLSQAIDPHVFTIASTLGRERGMYDMLARYHSMAVSKADEGAWQVQRSKDVHASASGLRVEPRELGSIAAELFSASNRAIVMPTIPKEHGAIVGRFSLGARARVSGSSSTAGFSSGGRFGVQARQKVDRKMIDDLKEARDLETQMRVLLFQSTSPSRAFRGGFGGGDGRSDESRFGGGGGGGGGGNITTVGGRGSSSSGAGAGSAGQGSGRQAAADVEEYLPEINAAYSTSEGLEALANRMSQMDPVEFRALGANLKGASRKILRLGSMGQREYVAYSKKSADLCGISRVSAEAMIRGHAIGNIIVWKYKTVMIGGRPMHDVNYLAIPETLPALAAYIVKQQGVKMTAEDALDTLVGMTEMTFAARLLPHIGLDDWSMMCAIERNRVALWSNTRCVHEEVPIIIADEDATYVLIEAMITNPLEIIRKVLGDLCNGDTYESRAVLPIATQEDPAVLEYFDAKRVPGKVLIAPNPLGLTEDANAMARGYVESNKLDGSVLSWGEGDELKMLASFFEKNGYTHPGSHTYEALLKTMRERFSKGRKTREYPFPITTKLRADAEAAGAAAAAVEKACDDGDDDMTEERSVQAGEPLPPRRKPTVSILLAENIEDALDPDAVAALRSRSSPSRALLGEGCDDDDGVGGGDVEMAAPVATSGTRRSSIIASSDSRRMIDSDDEDCGGGSSGLGEARAFDSAASARAVRTAAPIVRRTTGSAR
jgi:hypothetical protein